MSTLSQKAYRQIHDRIVSGHLRPGAVISEANLARDLGMSRTPVGEAIRKLANEGLVDQVPRFGTVVRTIDRRDVVELFEMREALESYAATRAAECISAIDLAKLQVLCDAMQRIADEVCAANKVELNNEELKAFLSADMAFHMLILQASGNARMLRAVTETRAVSSIFRLRRQKHDLRIVQMAHDQHLGILAALKDGDGKLAHQRMAEHIVASKSQTLAQLDQDSSETSGELPSDLPADVIRELEQIEKAGPA